MISINKRNSFAIAIAFVLILNSMLLSQQYLPGEVYYGRNNYVEYHVGDLPLIFSAPHGGSLKPNEIPNRTYGTTVTDSFTKETVLAIQKAMYDSTGHYPHIIISNLKRTKLDPNREIVEAAQGNQWAEQAWEEYHGFIETAQDTIIAHLGKGFYADIHGHGHQIQRLELGYLISGSNLFKSDNQLDAGNYSTFSSISTLASYGDISFAKLLRGEKSLGTLFEENNISAIPSLSQPNAGIGNPYFYGGYSTWKHSSNNGGNIDGVQIEAYRKGLRDTPVNRAFYAKVITKVFLEFFEEHYNFILDVEKDNGPIPNKLFLAQNYPNPFNPTTTIKYSIPVVDEKFSFTTNITIIVYNVLGKEVVTLVNEKQSVGNYSVVFEAKDLPSGIYLYRLQRGKYSETKKLIVLK